MYSDKKDNNIFLIYKEIQMGSDAKSYMRKSFLIYEEMRKFFPICEDNFFYQCMQYQNFHNNRKYNITIFTNKKRNHTYIIFAKCILNLTLSL
jgi:hypothetical protein